jgi:hypothetical protein
LASNTLPLSEVIEPDQIGPLHQVPSNDTSAPLTLDAEDTDGGGPVIVCDDSSGWPQATCVSEETPGCRS